MEGKGKQPSTIDSFRRHIAVLARNANLSNPQEVELAIATYKLTNPLTKELTKKPTSNNTKPPLSKNTSGSEYTSLKGTLLAPKDSVFAKKVNQYEGRICYRSFLIATTIPTKKARKRK